MILWYYSVHFQRDSKTQSKIKYFKYNNFGKDEKTLEIEKQKNPITDQLLS